MKKRPDLQLGIRFDHALRSAGMALAALFAITLWIVGVENFITYITVLAAPFLLIAGVAFVLGMFLTKNNDWAGGFLGLIVGLAGAGLILWNVFRSI